MRDLNPADNSVIQKDRSWHSDGDDARIGFINRDASVSETISAPQVQYPLGRIMRDQLSRMNTEIPTGTTTHLEHIVSPWNTVASATSVPGIMTFHFEPIFANGSNVSRGGQSDIFVNKWTKMRILNNMTEKFQPGDLQAITSALMNIDLHVANIRRALRVMQAVTMHAKSAYHSPTALMAALGWPMKEQTMRQNFVQWRNMFNQTILGNLNTVRWFKDLIPGAKRWASLVSEIYKDTSADTDYCQLMLLRPEHLWRCIATYDTEHKAYQWSLNYEHSNNIYWLNAPTDDPDDDDEKAKEYFENYLSAIADEIRNVFYDDSTMSILATINAIFERKMDNGIEIDQLSYDLFPLDPDPIQFTWDFKMMLALHNATILDVEPGAATIDPSSGIMSQFIEMIDDTRNCNAIAFSGKVLNLPCFGATNADIANAVQWMTIAHAGQTWSASHRYLSPGSYSTEILVQCRVYYFSAPAGSTSADGRIHSFRYQQALPVPIRTATPQMSQDYDGSWNLSAIFASAFAFAPMLYYINATQDSSSTPRNYLEGVSGQLEVLYAVDFGVLNEIHNQFANNFWGFPIDLPAYGKPAFEASDT